MFLQASPELLNFVLAESALELVPNEIRSSAAVARDAKRRGVGPARILLDRSFHHSAMSKLRDSEKRGRPDLVHATLLSVTSAPFYLDGRVRVFIHTSAGAVVEVAPRTRIPKNYIRFRGLMEEALHDGRSGELIRSYQMSFKDLTRKATTDVVFGLSVQGRMMGIPELAAEVLEARSPGVVVGGFPRGHFSKETLGSIDELVRIDSRPLEAHVVAARVIYEIEKKAKGIND